MHWEEHGMEIKLELEPAVVLFYTRIAATAGVPLEKVLADALFKLAGELSLEALQKDARFIFQNPL
jgi:hypothetical protein